MPHTKVRASTLLLTFAAAFLLCVSSRTASAQATGTPQPSVIQFGNSSLQVDVQGTQTDLPRQAIEDHVRRAAQAVFVFYGRFPVPAARIAIRVAAGEDGVLQGTTWGNVDGFPAVTRLRIGQHTTQAQLDQDWIATHELIHMSLANLPDAQQWLEEGIATYVEPVARVQAGQLKPEKIWTDMFDGMANGLPQTGDHGLNHTHTWGRTYWGGALFCLVADLEIRRETGNRRGLQDALRAIVEAGATIDKDMPVARVLHLGDLGTGTTVLTDQYARWSERPVSVDLSNVWTQLGVDSDHGQVVLEQHAPLAQVRIAITAPR